MIKKPSKICLYREFLCFQHYTTPYIGNAAAIYRVMTAADFTVLPAEQFLCLIHAAAHRHGKRTSLFTRAAFHALARSVVKRQIMLAHAFGHVVLLRKSQIEVLIDLRYVDMLRARQTVIAIHASSCHVNLISRSKNVGIAAFLFAELVIANCLQAQPLRIVMVLLCILPM